MKMASFDTEHVSCWPYARGYYHRSFVLDLWYLIEQTGDWASFLWDAELNAEGTPVSTFADPLAWMNYFYSLEDPKWWLIHQSRSTGEICGLSWFDCVHLNHAYVNIYVMPKYRGSIHTREIAYLTLEYAFYVKGWEYVLAMTPWAVVRNLAIRCGFEVVNRVPPFFTHLGKPLPIYLLSCPKARWEVGDMTNILGKRENTWDHYSAVAEVN